MVSSASGKMFSVQLLPAKLGLIYLIKGSEYSEYCVILNGVTLILQVLNFVAEAVAEAGPQ